MGLSHNTYGKKASFPQTGKEPCVKLLLLKRLLYLTSYSLITVCLHHHYQTMKAKKEAQGSGQRTSAKKAKSFKCF